MTQQLSCYSAKLQKLINILNIDQIKLRTKMNPNNKNKAKNNNRTQDDEFLMQGIMSNEEIDSLSRDSFLKKITNNEKITIQETPLNNYQLKVVKLSQVNQSKYNNKKHQNKQMDIKLNDLQHISTALQEIDADYKKLLQSSNRKIVYKQVQLTEEQKSKKQKKQSVIKRLSQNYIKKSDRFKSRRLSQLSTIPGSHFDQNKVNKVQYEKMEIEVQNDTSRQNAHKMSLNNIQVGKKQLNLDGLKSRLSQVQSRSQHLNTTLPQLIEKVKNQQQHMNKDKKVPPRITMDMKGLLGMLGSNPVHPVQNNNQTIAPKSVPSVQQKAKIISRVTMGMNDIMKMLNQPTSQTTTQNLLKKDERFSRVTMDMGQLTKMLSGVGKNQKGQGYNNIQQGKKDDLLANKNKQQFIIYEDQNQDDITPLKSKQNRHLSNKPQSLNPSFQLHEMFPNKQQGQKSPQHEKRAKQVFQKFSNLGQNIKKQKKKIQQLLKKKQQMQQYYEWLTQYITPSNISLVKQQIKINKQRIQSFKQQFQFQKWQQQRKYIKKIQSEFSIRILSYQRLGKIRLNNQSQEQKNRLDGFFIQISIYGLFLRIKRPQNNQVIVRAYKGRENRGHNIHFQMQFDFQAKSVIYSRFINYISKSCLTAYDLLRQLSLYTEQLKVFEVTLEYLNLAYGFSEITLAAQTNRFVIKYTLGQNNYNYQIYISLAQLLELNGGIEVKAVDQDYMVDIPENVFLQTKQVRINPEEKQKTPVNNKFFNVVTWIQQSVFSVLHKSLETKDSTIQNQ